MDIKKRLLTYPVLAAFLGASIYFSANTYFNRHKYETKISDFANQVSAVLEELPADTIRVRLPGFELSEKPTQVTLEGYVLEGPGNGRFREFTLINRPGINASSLHNFVMKNVGSLIDIKPTTKSVLDGTTSTIYPDEISTKRFTHDYNSRLEIRSYLDGAFGGN